MVSDAGSWRRGHEMFGDGPFVNINRGVVDPRRRDDAIELFRRVLDEDHNEPGTRVQSFQFERDNPNVFWIYEVYANADARERHRQHNSGRVRHDLEEVYSVWPVSRLCVPLFAKGVAFD
jgi:quinol monooxygenase YgiN